MINNTVIVFIFFNFDEINLITKTKFCDSKADWTEMMPTALCNSVKLTLRKACIETPLQEWLFRIKIRTWS